MKPSEEEGLSTGLEGEEGIEPPDQEHIRLLSGHVTPTLGAGPASPVSSQSTEGPFDYQVPPFQWRSREISVLVNSCGKDFDSPTTKETIALYRACLEKASMRATDWTYYWAKDEVKPTTYHPDWPDELRELGPMQIPAGSDGSLNKKRNPAQCPDILWENPAAKAC